MTAFRPDGHLNEEALLLLFQDGEAPDGLFRLEAAEHLAYCGHCLQRYTALLDAGPLLTPARSCQRSLWARIRIRAVQAFTSRYAAAAAAVILALTLLWSDAPVRLSQAVLDEDRPAITQRIGDSLTQAMEGLTGFLDGFRSHS